MRIEACLALLVGAQVAQDQVDVRVIGRLPGQLASQRIMVVGAAILLAGNEVLDVAVVLVADESEASLPVVGERAGNGAFDDLLVEAAIGPGHVTLEFLGRLS